MSSLAARSFAQLITLTRASAANYWNAAGIMTAAANDQPRIEYDPATRVARGLLIEGAATNLLLNSAALSTQNVTVTAQPYTLSFYGTGNVVLSGAASASRAGSSLTQRSTLTFTPSAGTLTLTVSGTVNYAQLEAGPYATSWITTTGASASRSAEAAYLTTLGGWFEEAAGTVFAEYLVPWTYSGTDSANLRRVVQIDDGTENNRHIPAFLSTGNRTALTTAASALQAQPISSAFTVNVVQRQAYAWSANDVAAAASGGIFGADTSATMPTGLTKFRIGGAVAAGSELLGYIRALKYYPRRLSDNELRALVA